MYPEDIVYYDLYKGDFKMFDLRLKMAQSANLIGNKPTAKIFKTTVLTVKKWKNRYNEFGKKGLKDVSKKPYNSPNKLNEIEQQKIIKLRKQTHFGANRLKHEFELDFSNRTIHKIIKKAGLVPKRRKKKHHTKQDLREVKAKKYKPLEFYQMDVKHLYDIPNYYKYIVQLKLPRYQYTIREVRTGALFTAYADSCNMTYLCLYISLFLNHLKNCEIDLKNVIIQTDNGSEFSGQEKHLRDRGFKYTVEKTGAEHRFIPPGCCNANADVESSHARIEYEFFDLESFNSKKDFYSKVSTFQFYFNFFRKNSYKNWKSPVDLYKEWLPDFNYKKYFYFYPLDLISIFNKIYAEGVTMSVNRPKPKSFNNLII
jgi:transposase